MTESRFGNPYAEVKEEIINATLVVAAIAGSIAYGLSLFRYFDTGFHFSFLTEFIVIACLCWVSLQRKKLKNTFKTAVIIFLIFLFTLSDAFNYGLFSSARVYLLLIPFFAVLSYPTRQSLLLFIAGMLSFLFIGYLHHRGVLTITDNYDPATYIGKMYPWIINSIHISIVAMAVMVVSQKLVKALLGFVAELKNYRERLEVLVQERTKELEAANEELVAANEELKTQSEDLESAYLHLKETQQQLVRSEKMASLGILASGVAHEINNPLNFIAGGIMGLENYFEDNLNEHTPEIQPLLSGMQEGIKRASAIVASLNHYTQKGDDISLSQCNASEILDRCVNALQPQINNRIEIVRDYAADLPLFNCREGKLHQALLNIITNAVQAIDDKGKIVVRTCRDNDTVHIEIEDTGCGIHSKDLNHITDPFFTTKAPGKGTGLGLSIAATIIEEHKGEMQISSQKGTGTLVKLKLPVL